MRLRRGPTLRWTALSGYSLLIFVLSSRGDLKTGLEHLRGSDKLAHTAAYTVWGWLGSSALHATWTRLRVGPGALVAGTLGTLYGASDEIHQSFVPGREADALDLAVDALGSFLGAALHALWSFRSRSRGQALGR